MIKEQYDNILEMLRKVLLLLKETTANYAGQIVETGAEIQGLYRVSNYASPDLRLDNNILHMKQLSSWRRGSLNSWRRGSLSSWQRGSLSS